MQKKICNIYSRTRAGRVYPHETDIQETHSNHRKLDSQATISHRARGRAPDGLRAQVRPPIHPHMLRHACGFKLANDGHDTRALQHYLGHKNIQHTVRYTKMAADRFKDFWGN